MMRICQKDSVRTVGAEMCRFARHGQNGFPFSSSDMVFRQQADPPAVDERPPSSSAVLWGVLGGLPPGPVSSLDRRWPRCAAPLNPGRVWPHEPSSPANPL